MPKDDPNDDLDFDLDLAPDPQEEPEGEAEETPAQEPSADDGIEALRQQLAAERAARQEAERRAQAAALEAHHAKVEVDDTNLQLVNNAIDTVSNDMAALKQGYAQAMADQDFTRAAEINAQISEQASNLQQLKLGRDAMIQKPKQAAPEAPVGDPVERFISALSPQSAAWVRAHPECVTNPALNRKMLLAHAVAVDDGITVDTPAYFAAIEKRLGLAKPEEDDAMSSAAKPVTRDVAPAAAPVSRVGGSSAQSNTVRLTREEREIAEATGMKPEEYAKVKMALIKEGRIKEGRMQ